MNNEELNQRQIEICEYVMSKIDGLSVLQGVQIMSSLMCAIGNNISGDIDLSACGLDVSKLGRDEKAVLAGMVFSKKIAEFIASIGFDIFSANFSHKGRCDNEKRH